MRSRNDLWPSMWKLGLNGLDDALTNLAPCSFRLSLCVKVPPKLSEFKNDY